MMKQPVAVQVSSSGWCDSEIEDGGIKSVSGHRYINPLIVFLMAVLRQVEKKLATLGLSLPLSIFLNYFPCSLFVHSAKQTEIFSTQLLDRINDFPTCSKFHSFN
jgi:hypothetical protein